MEKVKIKPYIGTKMILLAFNWESGKDRSDFLGFAIKRSPGYGKAKENWLPNRISFDGPVKGREFPSNKSPIQKFMWWDNRVNHKDRSIEYTYTIYPVVGSKDNLNLVENAKSSIKTKLLPDEFNGVGTYFNRAVVSSHAFSKKFPKGVTSANKLKALKWLADGLEQVIPSFLNNSDAVEGAIYHLEDKYWIIPAFEDYPKSISLVYDNAKGDDKTNSYAVSKLGGTAHVQLLPRTRTSIMHNKFLVKLSGNKATEVLMGSANFTTDGLSQQANYLHTFACPELAEHYLGRKRILEDDPKKAETAKLAEWSDEITFNGLQIRAYFSPEKKPGRIAMSPIIDAINNAKKSVVFSLFSPTDFELRNVIFEAADRGLMMFGLINKVDDTKPERTSERADVVARVEIYHRSKNNKDVYWHSYFKKDEAPDGFWWEKSGFGKRKHPVYIHHKFIVIDAETDNPTIYTGSANMSNNSNYNNDENLLEIKGGKELASIYLAEFLRLYEHYRARVQWDDFIKKEKNQLISLREIQDGQKTIMTPITQNQSQGFQWLGNSFNSALLGGQPCQNIEVFRRAHL